MSILRIMTINNCLIIQNNGSLCSPKMFFSTKKGRKKEIHFALGIKCGQAWNYPVLCEAYVWQHIFYFKIRTALEKGKKGKTTRTEACYEGYWWWIPKNSLQNLFVLWGALISLQKNTELAMGMFIFFFFNASESFHHPAQTANWKLSFTV